MDLLCWPFQSAVLMLSNVTAWVNVIFASKLPVTFSLASLKWNSSVVVTVAAICRKLLDDAQTSRASPKKLFCEGGGGFLPWLSLTEPRLDVSYLKKVIIFFSWHFNSQYLPRSECTMWSNNQSHLLSGIRQILVHLVMWLVTSLNSSTRSLNMWLCLWCRGSAPVLWGLNITVFIYHFFLFC